MLRNLNVVKSHTLSCRNSYQPRPRALIVLQDRFRISFVSCHHWRRRWLCQHSIRSMLWHRLVVPFLFLWLLGSENQKEVWGKRVFIIVLMFGVSNVFLGSGRDEEMYRFQNERSTSVALGCKIPDLILSYRIRHLNANKCQREVIITTFLLDYIASFCSDRPLCNWYSWKVHTPHDKCNYGNYGHDQRDLRCWQTSVIL